jgi:uncharacterized protein
VNATDLQSAANSDLARRRFIAEEHRPLMFSDWINAAFIHFEVEPRLLQPQVPFKLDLFEGKAYVSVVTFSIQRLRTALAGRFTETLFRPLSNHEFFNVRTYVRHGDRVGIYFMAEWLNNRLSVLLGPRTYGLPYRYGELDYDNQSHTGILTGRATASERSFEYSAQATSDHFTTCLAGSLDEFLLERYTAFTSGGRARRYFQIWHEPWPMVPLQVDVRDNGILRSTGSWFNHAKVVGGNFSPGVRDIWMSAPHRVRD